MGPLPWSPFHNFWMHRCRWPMLFVPRPARSLLPRNGPARSVRTVPLAISALFAVPETQPCSAQCIAFPSSSSAIWLAYATRPEQCADARMPAWTQTSSSPNSRSNAIGPSELIAYGPYSSSDTLDAPPPFSALLHVGHF